MLGRRNRNQVNRNAPSGPVIGRRPFLVGAATFAVGGFPLPPRWDRSRPAPWDVLTFFDTVGLMRGHQDGAATPGWVRKWIRPVGVHIHGTPDLREVAEVESILTTLSNWTGLSFDLSPTPTGGGAHIDLHFRDRAEMDERYGAESRTVCHCETNGNGGALHTGEIEVSTGFTDCLRHEFMHALGFDNHWTGWRATSHMPSVLALRFAAARVDRFSYCDELAVRTLYDPRLRPGMPRGSALRSASAILTDLLHA
jgi:hypothetical protein